MPTRIRLADGNSITVSKTRDELFEDLAKQPPAIFQVWTFASDDTMPTTQGAISVFVGQIVSMEDA